MKKYCLGLMLAALLAVGTVDTQAGVIHIGRQSANATTTNTTSVTEDAKTEASTEGTDYWADFVAFLAGVIHIG